MQNLIIAASVVLIVLGFMLLQASTWELMWYQSCTSRGNAQCFMPDWLQSLIGPSAATILAGIVLLFLGSRNGKTRGLEAVGK